MPGSRRRLELMLESTLHMHRYGHISSESFGEANRISNATARSPWTGGLCVAVCSTLIWIALSGLRPLWLDEIQQLLITRQPSVSRVISAVPQSSGASPLGYLVQQFALQVTGYSLRLARLPEALFGGAAVFVVFLLARELDVESPWISAVAIALFPMITRYSTESRVYMIALFWSVLATYIYVKMTQRPVTQIALWYTVVMVAAIYCQPYAASVGVAHVLWSLAQKAKKPTIYGILALILTAVAYLPWYLRSKEGWIAGITREQFSYSFSAGTPLMIFREILGAGYWGSGLLVVLAVLALGKRRLEAPTRDLCTFLIAVPIIVALCVDAWYHYFVAVRQFLWVLPSIAISIAAFLQGQRLVVYVLTGVLGVICLSQSYKYFRAPAEDWGAAAAVAHSEVREGACFLSIPPEHRPYYTFFEPDLDAKRCEPGTRRMAVAVSPYASKADQQTAVNALLFRGFVVNSENVWGRSRILSLSRGAP